MPIQEQSVRDRYETVRDEVLSHPGILAVTTVGHLPTNITLSSTPQNW